MEWRIVKERSFCVFICWIEGKIRMLYFYWRKIAFAAKYCSTSAVRMLLSIKSFLFCRYG